MDSAVPPSAAPSRPLLRRPDESVRALRPGALDLRQALRTHWPEYMMEAAELGIFMLAACLAVALLEHPASPVAAALPHPVVRRVLIGLAMGLTAIGIVYSPWGKRSGAHFNPAVTLTFWRLGKIAPADAAFYTAAHFAGAAAGVALAGAVLGAAVAHPAVNYVATTPGARGPFVAFAAEACLSFGLMSVVLQATNRPRLAPYTGLLCGALVALYISIEAPLSGMSMNPARSFGPAVIAQVWSGLWIYFVAPPLGMLLAAEVFVRGRRRRVGCAKLQHRNAYRCIFCLHQHG